MQRLLQDKDAAGFLAARVTREQAGILIAPLCKAGAAFVQAADAAADAGQADIWRKGPPPWNLQRVIARIDSVDESMVGLGLVLKSLAKDIDFMRACGFVELVFYRRAACNQKQASMLGCHTLRVVNPWQFLRAMEMWVCNEFPKPYAKTTMWNFADRTISHLVINLLAQLGLKRKGGKNSRCGPHPKVKSNEPLWVKTYVAV